MDVQLFLSNGFTLVYLTLPLRAGENSLRKIFHQFIREEETNMKENMDEAKLSSIKNLKVKIPDHS